MMYKYNIKLDTRTKIKHALAGVLKVKTSCYRRTPSQQNENTT